MEVSVSLIGHSFTNDVEILRILNKQDKPTGSKLIADELKEKGFKIVEKVNLEPYEKDHIALLVEKNF